MSKDKPTVIVVDDDEIITETIAAYLELATEYEVLVFNDPKTALDELQGRSFDVVISDFMMPDMNGLDFLLHIKKQSPEAIKILLTGYADKENAIRAINELEIFQYIEKPWDNEELCMVIKNGLEKKSLMGELTKKISELEASRTKIEDQRNEISRLYEMLQKDYETEIENVENVLVALAKAIEAKDKYTEGHTDRVSHIAVKIGERLELSDDQLKMLKIGGLVHDIGKIGVPENILNKPGRLEPAEFEIIKTHPAIGENICKPLNSLNYVLSIIRHHREKLNGTGYPDGLSGEQIAMEPRIIAVADIFDAISSDRPYRQKMSREEVFKVMTHEKEVGNLDTGIVDTLLALVNEGEISF